MSLKIAMVVACPFPANHGTPGGIRELAQAVSDKGHKVHIVTYHYGEGLNPRGVKLHRIWDWGFKKKMVVGPTKEKPVLDLLMVVKLCGVIFREKIDLIHGHNYEGALIGFFASVLTRRPLVYHAINTMIDELPSYNFFKPKILAVWIARFLDFVVPRLGDEIIAISEDLVRFLKSRNISQGRVHLIPLGVDTQRFEGLDPLAMRKKYGWGDRLLVVYTGTVDRFQRIDYLLNAMQIVCQNIPKATLFLVCNVPSEKDLKECHRMVEACNLTDHVEINHKASMEEVPFFLSGADVAVVSRPDCPGFPIKLLNYMAAAKAIVLFEGTSKGLEHLKNAFIVKDHDYQAMAQGIITILSDFQLREKLGRNAKEWVDEKFAWPTLVQQIEQVYFKLVNK
ncbi:MAG TPA: glycosyltransferase family 4 protein [Nitrospiria bacterium]|jgi:glycosyltransferase involved in cell wall biosynthesis